MDIIFFQSSWSFETIWGVIATLVGIVLAFLYLASKSREQTLTIETKRADSNAALIVTRDTRIGDLEKRNGQVETELEDVTTEYRTLAGVDIKKLMDYWAAREEELFAMAELRRENRTLRRMAGVGENDDIHSTGTAQ